ncbi:MAG TPA: isovaleryl-CoA dehydrogenase [Actinomycetota bacterium]|nr:isovaleryl-CoA dehydrogenase [Actinomycetota bacterium]
MTDTHEVINQAEPLLGHNWYRSDRALVEAVHREGGAWAEDRIDALGAKAASPEATTWATQANVYPPVLRTHDRVGNRIDEVEFHPAWHELMRVSVGAGTHALPWREPRAGAHVARAAMMMVWQTDAGHGCPISMTYSVIPALRKQPELAAEWEPRLLSLDYDERFVPAPDKRGALAGMAMTEKQGGSDVRANTTRAVPVNGGGPGAEYEITGHKWFCSAPMCDMFLVLAQAPGGLSCFLLPRWRPDGTRNAFRIQRLKDKLGNRSNASSEVEFHGAYARMVGEEGRGVPTIIEMVNHTRLDCVLGSTAGMRYGLMNAIHHTSQRAAFGRVLIEQPLMQNVLADLAVEAEAATVTAMRLARAYDAAADDEQEALFKRVATAIAKYWICKRQPAHVGEALECFGGNGYVEDSGMPRLYREAPLNSIWEGSGNVICLDVLRAFAKTPGSLDAFFAEVSLAEGADARLDAYVKDLRNELATPGDMESRARRLVERLALALQGSLLVRHSPPEIADAFSASRLAGDWGRAFGTLPSRLDLPVIVERATPIWD